MKKIGLLFPGQGSQAVGMGKDFIENSDIAKLMVQEASDRLGFDVKALLLEPSDKLEQTAYTQPAILLTSLMAYKIFESQTKIKPTLAIGHSLGEFSALTASGAISVNDAIYVVNKRGEWMQEACVGGGAGMAVVLGLADDIIGKVCADAQAKGLSVWAANFNADGQVVLAGKKDDLSAVEADIKAAGAKRFMLLPMSVASHCPLLDSAATKLNGLLGEYVTDSFAFPVISNVSAKPYNTKEDAIALLVKQLTSSVLYKQSIKAVENNVDLFVEFGHGTVLSGLNKKGTPTPTKNISDIATLNAVLEEIL